MRNATEPVLGEKKEAIIFAEGKTVMPQHRVAIESSGNDENPQVPDALDVLSAE